MERPLVYVDTTIPSAYFDRRTSREMVETRAATRSWWIEARRRCALVVSHLVLEELRRGPPDRRSEWLGLVEALDALEPVEDCERIAAVYLSNRLAPSADALHLAFASYYNCEVLVTWDRRHLANPNKSTHLHVVNRRLGLHVPQLLTPAEMLARWR